MSYNTPMAKKVVMRQVIKCNICMCYFLNNVWKNSIVSFGRIKVRTTPCSFNLKNLHKDLITEICSVNFSIFKMPYSVLDLNNCWAERKKNRSFNTSCLFEKFFKNILISLHTNTIINDMHVRVRLLCLWQFQ